MSKGHLKLDAAIGIFATLGVLGVLALIIFVIAPSTREEKQRIAVGGPAIEERASAEADQDTRYGRWAQATPRGVLEDIQPPTSPGCEYDSDCREQEDLRAQQSVALSTSQIVGWTQFQTLIAAFGTMLLWWGLLLNRDATRAATEQSQTARLSLCTRWLSHRCYRPTDL
jgi:hypothetical protein